MTVLERKENEEKNVFVFRFLVDLSFPTFPYFARAAHELSPNLIRELSAKFNLPTVSFGKALRGYEF